ncbi:MAG: ribosome small subunit-dependent GTPase A, partial [Gemmatimonadetes bacterium]|nr:ribosome small subunit-dependent GTPase A [Gemmatimonadota bacterium]NIQ55126.1 ribosome small subunit-dependent GTPase A [Gemmatimonadota bacterium]NIU75322.1 ribosome small subunit-dependent GTPase A [Gammaproteobacteria bacterium]NIX45105.1 ribosome small subunit-dependent GTPase A [Gemmatimonadota bacterium]
MASDNGHHPGLVRTAVGGAYGVELYPGRSSSELVEASLRGRLKQDRRTGDAVVPGDRVRVLRHDDGSHTIEAVEDRRSELARRAPGRQGAHRAKVVVANVDQLVAVFSVTHPEPRLRMLDRFLVLAEANGLEAAVVANKIDLDPEAVEPFAVYGEIGYPVLFTSAETGEGVEEIQSLLRDRISVLAGPSGVGKSSLLNAVEPGFSLRVGDVSDAVRKGRKGGYVADTPGLRELGLWGIDDQDLGTCFPEFRSHLASCQFRSCSHTHEPGCAVQAAVEDGSISRDRYDSYVAMLESDG